jgi:phospholipid/cholesterol/gamma-HCH transport system substrate-binding protein
MLTRFIKFQLVTFIVLTVLALVGLSIYYLRLPSLAGIGEYSLTVDLPSAGGLYKTSNVTYRGATIGQVTDLEPTEKGARATLRIADKFKIPVDASANVHSVTAIGEQYLDLVSDGKSSQYFKPGQTITKSTVPQPVGPALDAAYRNLAALPVDKIPTLLDETAQAFGGLGPTLQKLTENTSLFVDELNNNITDINDLVDNSPPLLDTQIQSADAIYRWAANLNSLTAQGKAQDPALRSSLQQAAPTAEALNTLFIDVKDGLPQTLAVTQAVFVQIGETTFAVPVASVSGIGRLSREQVSDYAQRKGIPQTQAERYAAAFQWENRAFPLIVPEVKSYRN